MSEGEKKTVKWKWYWPLLLIMAFIVIAGWWMLPSMSPRSHSEKEASVLLERVRSVAKMVSVEGYFSEIYTYENSWEPLPNVIYSPTFDKKLITIVKAKVSVGFDLNKMNIEADHTEGVLRIRYMPPPEIISIDHDLEYYDVQESSFNTFTREEMNVINADAKRFIKEKALQSSLFEQAENERQKMLETLTLMLEGSGWEIVYEKDAFYDWEF